MDRYSYRPLQSTLLRLELVTALAFGSLLAERAYGVTTADEVHWTGLRLVGPEVMQITPRDEVQAMAVSAAIDFAIAHPNDVSFPWVDASGEMIQLSAATDVGEQLLLPLASALPTPHEVRRVSQSFGDLEQLKFAVSLLRGSGIEGGELIWRLEPDWKNSRVIVTVSEANDGLFQELVQRFGTQAVAVRVDPDVARAISLDSRQLDLNPFNGGARYYTPSECSVAFSWANGTLWQGMLTAGHVSRMAAQSRPPST